MYGQPNIKGGERLAAAKLKCLCMHYCSSKQFSLQSQLIKFKLCNYHCMSYAGSLHQQSGIGHRVSVYKSA